MATTTCLLPCGYWDESGVRHTDAEIASLSGRDEEVIAESHLRSPAELLTTVLTRCVRRIGGVSPVSTDVARRLSTADRQFLLLRLSQLCFGDAVELTTACTRPGCEAKVDVSFGISDVPVESPAEAREAYEVSLPSKRGSDDSEGGTAAVVSFRLPNGGDQEALWNLALEDEEQASTALLRRCVLGVTDSSGRESDVKETVSRLPTERVLEAIDAVAPQVTFTMEARCPECESVFTVPFDPLERFLSRVGVDRDLLQREVHFLAYHYHWSEREIMEMPRVRRRAYIGILAEEIERLSDDLQ